MALALQSPPQQSPRPRDDASTGRSSGQASAGEACLAATEPAMASAQRSSSGTT